MQVEQRAVWAAKMVEAERAKMARMAEAARRYRTMLILIIATMCVLVAIGIGRAEVQTPAANECRMEVVAADGQMWTGTIDYGVTSFSAYMATVRNGGVIRAMTRDEAGRRPRSTDDIRRTHIVCRWADGDIAMGMTPRAAGQSLSEQGQCQRAVRLADGTEVKWTVQSVPSMATYLSGSGDRPEVEKVISGTAPSVPIESWWRYDEVCRIAEGDVYMYFRAKR